MLTGSLVAIVTPMRPGGALDLAVEDEEEPLSVRLDVEAPAAAGGEGVGAVPDVVEPETGDERDAVRRPDAEEPHLERLPLLLEEVEGGVDGDFLPHDLAPGVGLGVERLVEGRGHLLERRVLPRHAVVVAAPEALPDVQAREGEQPLRDAVEEKGRRPADDLLPFAGRRDDRLDVARGLDREVESDDAAVHARGDDVEALRGPGVEQLADDGPLEDLRLRPGKLDRDQRHAAPALRPSRAS